MLKFSILKRLLGNKDKILASLAALPTCFEYVNVGTKQYARPKPESVKQYYKLLMEIWEL